MIAVWFSCGAASAVAAKLAIKRFGGEHEVRVLNNPVMEEDEDNRRFLADVQDWLGQPIESVTNSKHPHCSAEVIWEQEQFMSSPWGAPCTRILKREARQQWESKNDAEFHVLGFTAEERDRHERFTQTERSNVVPTLIDAHLTKQDCFGIIQKAGIDLPRVYAEGMPNANCIGCVKAKSPTYWNLIREIRPAVFQRRAEQSRRIGARLVEVSGERIFLDELSPDAQGRPLKEFKTDCGLFCEEAA